MPQAGCGARLHCGVHLWRHGHRHVLRAAEAGGKTGVADGDFRFRREGMGGGSCCHAMPKPCAAPLRSHCNVFFSLALPGIVFFCVSFGPVVLEPLFFDVVYFSC